MDPSPQSEAVTAAVAKAGTLLNWINEKFPDIELKGDDRHRIPGQLFDLSLEHAAGILQLIAGRRYACAFALVRCQFECFVRGAWLHYCATDGELDQFVKNDKIKPRIRSLIEALEATPQFEDKLLSGVKAQAWDAMNGYTHGGVHQVSRRLRGACIEPVFENEALLEVIHFSGTMALIAFGEIAAMAGRHDLLAEAQANTEWGTSSGLHASMSPAVAAGAN